MTDLRTLLLNQQADPTWTSTQDWTGPQDALGFTLANGTGERLDVLVLPQTHEPDLTRRHARWLAEVQGPDFRAFAVQVARLLSTPGCEDLQDRHLAPRDLDHLLQMVRERLGTP